MQQNSPRNTETTKVEGEAGENGKIHNGQIREYRENHKLKNKSLINTSLRLK